tara:strand:+ start:343 stop:588 length:246 start_codon:yes stop_codon:yes gene_type:complete
LSIRRGFDEHTKIPEQVKSDDRVVGRVCYTDCYTVRACMFRRDRGGITFAQTMLETNRRTFEVEELETRIERLEEQQCAVR